MTQHSNSVDLESFRAEVRDFLRESIPQDIRDSVRANCLVTKDQAERWQKILHARGWVAPGWPKEHGGTGWSLVQQAVFKEELAASEAPRYENLGIDTIGPTLMRNGSAEQCARYLPRMLSFEDFWAQGYSEPDAGSDLASLRTTARREGDDFIVNGTKIWQSYGHWANWALVLVRSDPNAPRKQEGISVLLIDLTLPGVTVRPIRFMHGGVLHVQMFFDDVRVPASMLVGRENAGWSIAKGLLVTERLFVARVAECKAELEATRDLASRRGPAGLALLRQDVHARRLAELDIRTRALEGAWWPAVRAVEGGQEPALEASLLKLQGNEVLQDLQQLQMDLLGTDALVFDPLALQGTPSEPPASPGHVGNFSMHMWRYRGITLGGGTSEVQRGIVAKAIFAGQTDLDLPLAAGLSQEQAMLDDGLRRWLADRYDFDHRQGVLAEGAPDQASWTALCDLGLAGLLVPERDGGFGADLADVMPVMSALGEALVLEPVLWSTLLPEQLVIDASAFSNRDAALAALVAGARWAFAHEDGASAVTAARGGNGWRLNGRKKLVLGGDHATNFLVSARLEGGGQALFACAAGSPGLGVRGYRLHDGRGAADLRFDDLECTPGDRVAGPERAGVVIDQALDFATLALCAESTGAMRRALALTVEYLRTRKQFGQPLAGFQALQHRVVEHYRSWVHARTLVREAAAGWRSESVAERSRRVSAAKWMAGRAGRAIALDVLQLHGAVGLQDETAISHYAQRLLANDLLLGDATAHLGRFVGHSEAHGN